MAPSVIHCEAHQPAPTHYFPPGGHRRTWELGSSSRHTSSIAARASRAPAGHVAGRRNVGVIGFRPDSDCLANHSFSSPWLLSPKNSNRACAVRAGSCAERPVLRRGCNQLCRARQFISDFRAWSAFFGAFDNCNEPTSTPSTALLSSAVQTEAGVLAFCSSRTLPGQCGWHTLRCAGYNSCGGKLMATAH